MTIKKNEGIEIVLHLIWKLCNTTFESSIKLNNWSTAVIISLYKSKLERTDYKNNKVSVIENL